MPGSDLPNEIMNNVSRIIYLTDNVGINRDA